MGLLQKGSLAPLGGSIRLVGEELLGASDRRLRQLRATTMAMIFQEPMTALNPVSAGPAARSTKCCASIPVSMRGAAQAVLA